MVLVVVEKINLNKRITLYRLCRECVTVLFLARGEIYPTYSEILDTRQVSIA